MSVVGFITLLQNPFLGSPSWLPLLAASWAITFIITMVLQSTLPLPDIQRYVVSCHSISNADAGGGIPQELVIESADGFVVSLFV